MTGDIPPGGCQTHLYKVCVHNYIYIWENLLEGVWLMNKGVEVARNSFAVMVCVSRKKFGRAKTLSHMARLCG